MQLRLKKTRTKTLFFMIGRTATFFFCCAAIHGDPDRTLLSGTLESIKERGRKKEKKKKKTGDSRPSKGRTSNVVIPNMVQLYSLSPYEIVWFQCQSARPRILMVSHCVYSHSASFSCPSRRRSKSSAESDRVIRMSKKARTAIETGK